jgi:hypothetical protein
MVMYPLSSLDLHPQVFLIKTTMHFLTWAPRKTPKLICEAALGHRCQGVTRLLPRWGWIKLQLALIRTK